jgi:hypothetical protein
LVPSPLAGESASLIKRGLGRKGVRIILRGQSDNSTSVLVCQEGGEPGFTVLNRDIVRKTTDWGIPCWILTCVRMTGEGNKMVGSRRFPEMLSTLQSKYTIPGLFVPSGKYNPHSEFVLERYEIPFSDTGQGYYPLE